MEQAIRMTATSPARAGATPTETASATKTVDVRPRIDVLESVEGFRILADVPGVDAASADVSVQFPHLRIACARAARHGVATRFVAELTLPRSVDPDSVAAALRNGVLEISMQKTASARARRIEVHGR